MMRERRRLTPYALLGYPTLMLGVFFLVPFGIMLAVSFFHRVQDAFYEPGFELGNYARFLTPLFVEHLAFSLFLSALVAVVCIGVGFPFTYLLTRARHRVQVGWLIFILSVLSLSEVIVAFAWSLLLSKSAGISNVFAWLGLMEKATSWTPGFPALLAGFCYLAFPYTVLMLYPSVTRLNVELTEAAQTLGASPLRTFFTVVVPVLRPAILAGLVLVFVFTLGIYLIPQILGRPQHWTLSVLITDQAIYQSNIPFAAAMAVFLLVTSLALIALTFALGRGRRMGT